ncbi:glycosyltransferase family 4 protein [Candidatus Sumerlaeota bacterium]|nr:glycosyltransferase family 4 protein [Candidatus Sumerlaeota bacterium]
MPRPIHICLFCSTTGIGGTERMALAFLSRCDKAKFKPHFLTLLDDGGEALREAERLGVPRYGLNWRGRFNLGAFRRFKQYLRENQIDLIHNFGLRAELLSRPVSKRCGVKRMVSGIRDTDPWRRWYHVLADRATAGAVDLFIANSEGARQVSMRREKIPAEKIITIHNGIDLPRGSYDVDEMRQRHGIAPERSPVIVQVANLVPQKKGHDLLFEAVKRLLPDYPRLLAICVGHDKSNGAIPALAKEKGVEGAVHFTGYAPNVFEWLSLADVAVLPSRFESMPVSILEAMSMRLPVVASDAGGIPEVIQDGVNGRIIPTGQADPLYAALKELLNDPEQRTRLAQSARQSIENDFTLEAMTRRLEEVYLSLM